MNAMTLEEKMTAPNSSVGADAEQSGNNTNTIITDTNDNFNICDESFRRMQMNFLRELDSSYIKTVSMSELYERVFYSNPPIIHGLLYSGTYLFVGAPKLGKSFFMAQLAYHVSTGTPLWNYPVRKGTVLYLALKDDYRRLQSRLYRMFRTESTDRLFFAVSSHQLGKGLTEQLSGFIAEHKDTALATGISMFTDSFFKKIGEFDTINKCEIDDEIRENMNHFITPERTTDYYQR